MLKIHSEIAQSLGMPKSNIFVLENGEMIKLENHKVSYDSSFVCEPVYIDGRDINEVSSSVLKDREILKNDGLVTVAVGIDSSKGIITVNPIVITKAFICNYKNIKEEIAELVRKKLEVLVASKTTFSQIKAVIRNVVSQYIFRRTEREPMVIPVVMDKIK